MSLLRGYRRQWGPTITLDLYTADHDVPKSSQPELVEMFRVDLMHCINRTPGYDIPTLGDTLVSRAFYWLREIKDHESGNRSPTGLIPAAPKVEPRHDGWPLRTEARG